MHQDKTLDKQLIIIKKLKVVNEFFFYDVNKWGNLNFIVYYFGKLKIYLHINY